MLRSADGLGEIWLSPESSPQYYPLVHTSFWLEYRLWKLNPMGYHVTNVLLHIGASFLLWRALVLLGLPFAWIAAAIFAMHPVHVESVAWITERKNVLSLVFYLCSCISMLYWLRLIPQEKQINKLRGLYFFGLSFYIAALLSKSVVCSLPAALLLIVWWRKGTISHRDIISLIPFFIFGLVSGLSTAWLEHYHVGAQGAEWNYGWLERLLTASRIIWFYAGKLIYPIGLTFNYPRWSVSSQSLWQYSYPALLLLVFAMLSFWYYRRKISRGPIVAALFFCGTLFPALGFIDVYPFRYSFVADHFQYHASIGLIVLASQGIGCLAESMNTKLWSISISFLLCSLAVLTFHQSGEYKNIETLWRKTIEKNPNSILANNNLGLLFKERKEYDAALQLFNNIIDKYPYHAEAYNNIGTIYIIQGRYDDAADMFKRAIGINSKYVEAHYNLANLYKERGTLKEALSHCRQVLILDPDNSLGFVQMGELIDAHGNFKEAISWYSKALSQNPESAEIHLKWGQTLLNHGMLKEASEHFDEVLSLAPEAVKAINLKGIVFSRQAKLLTAEEYFRKAIGINADFVEGYVNLGTVLTQQGKVTEALTIYDQALHLEPTNCDALFGKGTALLENGMASEAERFFKKVIDLKSGYYQAILNLGIAKAMQQDFQSATEQFTLITKVWPESAEAFRNLAQAQWLIGKKHEARNSFKKLKVISDEEAEKLQKLIPSIGGSEN